jgi:hypothetical protein
MSPPERSPRGSGEAGRPRQGGSHGRARVHVEQQPAAGRIFLWKTLLRPSRSRPILPQPHGTGLCGLSALGRWARDQKTGKPEPVWQCPCIEISKKSRVRQYLPGPDNRMKL